MARPTVHRQAKTAYEERNAGVQVQLLKFVENGAGTYTGAVALSAGSVLHNIVVVNEALWTAGTSASLEVGDSDDPDGFFTAVDLKATDLLAGESISLESTQTRGGVGGAYTTVGTSTHIAPRYYAAAETITATVVSEGAGTAGRTTVAVVYSEPITDVNVTTVTQ